MRKIIQPIIKMTKDKMMDIMDINLIPDAVENLWRLSTAQMEADILRSLSSVAPLKQASPTVRRFVPSWRNGMQRM